MSITRLLCYLPQFTFVAGSYATPLRRSCPRFYAPGSVHARTITAYNSGLTPESFCFKLQQGSIAYFERQSLPTQQLPNLHNMEKDDPEEKK